MKISSHNIFVHILFAALWHKFCTCQERSSNDPEDGRDISISSGQDRGVFATLSDFNIIKDGLYSGHTRSRVPHGDGLLVYFTDDKYGRYNYSGKFEEGEIASLGDGITFYRNGNIYQGQYSGQGDIKGLPEGRGELRYVNGDVYAGFFKDGKRSGTGSLIYAADGNRREGQWIDDQLHGFVTFTCKSCNTKNRGNLRRENGSDQSKQIDVTKIERWRKGRRISDGVSERSPLVNLFDREDPKEDDNNNFDNISNEPLTPANFSRAFFKSASREIPIEVDRQSNQPPAVNIFDVLKDVSVFHFSASTPRNLVVEDSALKSRFQSSRSLKRHYDYVHEE